MRSRSLIGHGVVVAFAALAGFVCAVLGLPPLLGAVAVLVGYGIWCKASNQQAD